jgi:hypothetical protein
LRVIRPFLAVWFSGSGDFPFAMDRVGAAFGAELFDRELVGLRFFVFGGGVVAGFTGIAGK